MPTRPVGTMTFSVPELDPGPFRTTAGTPHSPAGSTVFDRRQRQARSGPTYQSPKKRHCAAEPETPKPETPNRLQTNILILILGNEYEHKPSKSHPMNRTTHIRRSFFLEIRPRTGRLPAARPSRTECVAVLSGAEHGRRHSSKLDNQLCLRDLDSAENSPLRQDSARYGAGRGPAGR